MNAAGTARTVFINGISFWAPQLPGWDVAAAVLRGSAQVPTVAQKRPSPELLPPAERRRAPDTVAVAAEVAMRACTAAAVDPAGLASVFSSVHGDLAITDYMCETLARTPLLVSPTRFHNSVHNAAAGYWCIATGCHAPYITVSAFGHSFAMGLLEAFAQIASDGVPVLYVAYDIEACGPLAAMAPSRGLLGAGLVLAPERSARTVARLTWSVRPGDGSAAARPRAARPGFPDDNAMSHCLPLFETLAGGGGPVTFTLGPRLLLELAVQTAQTQVRP